MIVRRAILFAALIAATGTAVAATYPIDDRASTPYLSNTRMLWTPIERGRGAMHTLAGRMIVQVRLDVRSWRRRTGNIYLRLDNTAIGPVTATWTSNGRLLTGEVRSGERTLVYAGPIQVDTLEDTLMLTINADGRRLLRQEPLNFSFEIDVN